MGPTGGGSSLIRYGSAPGSLLTAAVDSVIGQQRSKEFSPLGGHPPPRYFSSETSAKTSESTCKTAAAAAHQKENNSTINGLQSSYGSSLSSSSSPLVRHSSSPAGFLNRLASAASTDNGILFPLHPFVISMCFMVRIVKRIFFFFRKKIKLFGHSN